MNTISRRNFIKGAALGTASLTAAAGIAVADEAAAGTSWRTAPEPVAQIAEERVYDVVVVGHGYAGLSACRELAEQGVSVALIEQQSEDAFHMTGNESAAINSKLLIEQGVPEVDPVEYYQNFMAMAQNYPNPDLVMKFCKNMGEANDWYYGVLSPEQKATLYVRGYPDSPNRLKQIGPFKFFPGAACFETAELMQTDIGILNREAAKACGAEFFFENEALYLTQDESGAVTGVVAATPEGNVAYTAKAVIVATGGFCSNLEMLTDLCPDFIGNLCEGDQFAPGTSVNNGRGIQMAYWAGARLETASIPTMNSKHLDVPTNRTNIPQAVWLDESGKRFCNEYYPAIEQRCIPAVYRRRQNYYCVFDDDFCEYLTYSVSQHGTFQSTPSNIDAVRTLMDAAKAKFDGTWVEGTETPRAPITVDMCADTLEGLAELLGFTGEEAQNFVESIERYNGFCETGVDTEYGRYAETLFPVKKPPFYVFMGEPHMGKIMVTVGGVITDGEQNALDHEYEPIPGLYVSGNDCGRRFGTEYFTPTPGVSLAMAMALGRECGRSVLKYIQA